MTTPDPVTPAPITLTPERRRKLTIRKIMLALLVGVIFTAVSLHDQRYALLVGGGRTGETQGGMILLSCTYFTGTEKVINRTWRSAEAGASCPLLTKLDEAGILIERPLGPGTSGPEPVGPEPAAPAF